MSKNQSKKHKLEQIISAIETLQNDGKNKGILRLAHTNSESQNVGSRPSLQENVRTADSVTTPFSDQNSQQSNPYSGTASTFRERHLPIRMHLNDQVRCQLVINETEEIVEIYPQKEQVVLQFPDGKSLRIPRT